MNAPDVRICFPAQGLIRVRCPSLFADPGHPHCRSFLDRVFRVEAVSGVTIVGGAEGWADVRLGGTVLDRGKAVRRVADALGGRASRGIAALLRIAPASIARDAGGVVRYFRQGTAVSGWEVTSSLPGRVRVRNPVIYRKKSLCRVLERELTSVLGIERFATNPLTSTVLVHFDLRRLDVGQLIEILDSALAQAEHPEALDRPETDLPACTAALPLAAAAQFAAPPLLPAAAVVLVLTSLPTFREARRVFRQEKRLGVDALDAIVVAGCLGTLSVFPGAVCCWCLSFGRSLVRRTRDSSQRLLLDAFAKQPRFAWLCRDDGEAEVQVAADSLEKDDVILVHTGEAVPVDGHIVEGLAMVDQHVLTGESTPAEKGVGDRVYASTMLVAGRVKVAVEQSGRETASARISQILGDTAGYKLGSQHKGERMADRAVIPTLAAGAFGMATLGPIGAVAVLNSDLGTGIRMAAPLAMLSSLAVCAHRGILVKDGRALEQMNAADTVLFDKTGTLTRERPEVGRVLVADGFTPGRILALAAASERKFHHPIALAILHRAEELGLELPPTDETEYKVGYGITVRIEGERIRVGSRRFADLEGLEIPPGLRTRLDEAHHDGTTMVMVGVGGQLAGAIELQASLRPEAHEIVAGLRSRGIDHIAIISGDHEAPTRKLAEALGVDRYFAQVLPTDKAEYVERLQREGRKVCFVGDGLNDAIALNKADVSISLRGASTLATDTAQVIFLEGNLAKLCELRDIARDLDRNVNRSWSMIVAPNVSNVISVFTMGTGIMVSVITNNVSALAALANGLLPLRKVGREGRGRRQGTGPLSGAGKGSPTGPSGSAGGPFGARQCGRT